MNVNRLLNVARALREAPEPKKFNMDRLVHQCGTPACAFGHYAARIDLQDRFSINTTASPYRHRGDGVYLHTNAGTESISFDNEAVLEHFGIDQKQADELFGAACDYSSGELSTYAGLARMCRTPIEAAEYIESFVAEHARNVGEDVS